MVYYYCYYLQICDVRGFANVLCCFAITGVITADFYVCFVFRPLLQLRDINIKNILPKFLLN